MNISGKPKVFSELKGGRIVGDRRTLGPFAGGTSQRPKGVVGEKALKEDRSGGVTQPQ
ncbi:hypothetical protein L917_05958, partial [Phytophthora nicotianae]